MNAGQREAHCLSAAARRTAVRFAHPQSAGRMKAGVGAQRALEGVKDVSQVFEPLTISAERAFAPRRPAPRRKG